MKNTLLCSFCLLILGGCTEYWWTRGQPPSTAALYRQARSELLSANSLSRTKRPELAVLSDTVEKSLSSILQELAGSKGGENQACKESAISYFSSAEISLLELEPQLSYGSRPAYGELAGQFRRFQESCRSKHHLEYTAFGLFASRMLKFLASEISVSAPKPVPKPV